MRKLRHKEFILLKAAQASSDSILGTMAPEPKLLNYNVILSLQQEDLPATNGLLVPELGQSKMSFAGSWEVAVRKPRLKIVNCNEPEVPEEKSGILLISVCSFWAQSRSESWLLLHHLPQEKFSTFLLSPSISPNFPNNAITILSEIVITQNIT